MAADLAPLPATALQRHAHEQQYDLVVIGRRGRGITKRLLGWCATELARRSSVPIVIVPAEAEVDRVTAKEGTVTGS